MKARLLEISLWLAMVVVAVTGVSVYALEWQKACAYAARTDPDARWVLQDDGNGVYISSWISTVDEPTEAELQAVEATAIAWYDDKMKTEEADYNRWSLREKAMLKWLVKEINTLRVNDGLAPYTVTQVKAGIKAEM